MYLSAPVLIFILSLLNWLFMTFDFKNNLMDGNFNILYMFILSACSVYGVILGGWSSNSKYSHISVMRTVAQTISYEMILSLTMLPLMFCTGSLNLVDMVYAQHEMWFIFLFPLLAFFFFFSMLAETNRAPFDLPEAEGEIVAGYNLEYASMPFALFFLGEYCNILVVSSLFSMLYLGGWNCNIWYFWMFYAGGWDYAIFYYSIKHHIYSFLMKILIMSFLFILIRANFPSYSFDQLIEMAWKVIIPLCGTYLILMIAIFFKVPRSIENTTDLVLLYEMLMAS